jgi:hypothetical protein
MLTKSLWRRRLPGRLSLRIRRPDASSGGAATHTRIIGKLFAARWVAASGNADRMNPKPSVFAEATPMTNLRDAMITNAPGFLPNSFLPHSTASPAALEAAAAARLGVLPEWQSACLSTPPTPKKLGWW